MADLNITKSDTAHIWEDAGQNLTPNYDFEIAPSFTAATNTTARWVDGTAGGSTTNDIYSWALITKQGTVEASFDNTVSHGGSVSLKLSTTAVNSFIDIRLTLSNTVPNINRYYIPVYPSTQYKATHWLKTNVTSGDSSDGAYLTFIEYNATSTTATQTDPGSTKIKTTVDWTQYSQTFTTNSSTVFITPVLRVYGHTGTATLIMDAWFDDLQLQSVAPNGKVDIPVNTIVTPGIQNINGPKIWS